MRVRSLFLNLVTILVFSLVLQLAACGQSGEKTPAPKADHTMLQATIDALQATVDASDTTGNTSQTTVDTSKTTTAPAPPSPTKDTPIQLAPQSTPTSQPTSPTSLSLAEQLVGDWRWREGDYEEMFVLAADGRSYDTSGEEFGTYSVNPQEGLLELQYPGYAETLKIVDVSADRLRVAYSSGSEIELTRYGVGPVDAEQLAGLWSFEPNGLSEIEWHIFFDSQDNFLAWANAGGMAWSGRYEHFTDDVLILPGAPWEDPINGPPTLHVEALDGNRGHFSFPEVEIETGFDATRVREDEELARQLEGHWLFLDGEDQYEVELSTTFMSTVIGTFGEIEYTLRTFEDGTIGWFNNDDPGVLLCSTEFTGSAELTLECPANHPDAWQILLRRPG